MASDVDSQATLSAEQIRQACGDLSDATVEAIIATGATAADLSAALGWEARSFELRDDQGLLAGRAAAVREILSEDASFPEEDEWAGTPGEGSGGAHGRE